MELALAILLVLGSALALWAFIVTKKREAKPLLDQLAPVQAFIGIALLAVGAVELLRIGPVQMFRAFSFDALAALAMIAAVYSALVLGCCFGLPQLAKWTPGEAERSRRLASFQLVFGLIAFAAAVLVLLYEFRVLAIGR